MPKSGRGAERRAALVEAGIALLAESGWAGVTHRAVASRAGANPGLVHYYFQGSAGLRRAVAEAVCRRTIGTMADELPVADDETEIVTRVLAALESARADPQQGRLVTETVSAAFDDPEIGALVRAEFARTRSVLAEWYATQHPDWPRDRTRASATLLLAALDGLILHALLDPDVRTDGITELLTTERNP